MCKLGFGECVTWKISDHSFADSVITEQLSKLDKRINQINSLLKFIQRNHYPNKSKLLTIIFIFQEDSGLTESRPGTAQAVAHVDPLAIDIEDLYVKYKV